MKKCLVMHHFESEWNPSLAKFDTSFDKLNEQFLDYLENNNFEKIIITSFYHFEPQYEHYDIISFCENNNIEFEFINYGYGWYRDPDRHDEDIDEENQEFPLSQEGIKWIRSEREHHDENYVLIIDDFHYELKNYDVTLTGAFEGECVLDMEAVFNSIGVNYEKIDELVVGTYCEYEFQSARIEDYFPEKIEEFFNKLKENMEYEYYDIETAIKTDPDSVETFLIDLKEYFEDEEDNIRKKNYYYNNNELDFISDIFDKIEQEDSFDYLFDELNDKIEISNKIKENTTNYSDSILYHGTVWNVDEKHENLSISSSDNNVIHLSSSENVAEYFAERKAENDDILLVFQVVKELENIYDYDVNEHSKTFHLYDAEVDINDIKNMYKAFKSENFDGISFENNYENGNDVVLFNDIKKDEIKSVKAFVNDKWTNYMSFDELKDTLKQKQKINKKLSI